MDEEFEMWFDIFTSTCRSRLMYYGPIDKETFYQDYLDAKTPEESAEQFVMDMF